MNNYWYEVNLGKFEYEEGILISLRITKLYNDDGKIKKAYFMGIPYAELIDNEYIINLNKIANSPQLINMLLNEKYIEKKDYEEVYKLGHRALLELI